MSITAQLRDSVRLPGGDALVDGHALESRGDGSRRTLIRNGHELEVYDLDVRPRASYVRPLGDGTWLTYDSASGTLHRWSEPAS